MSADTPVTTLLRAWQDGDKFALQELTPIVYDDLRRIAARHMQTERAGHTLQPTALINEAFLRIAEADIDFNHRAHFFAIAARTMRRILTDYARARASEKRGSGQAEVTLQEDRVGSRPDIDVVDLDAAIEKLDAIDKRKSDILVLHYFGGMTYDETAAALDVSAATVDRELRLAKAWLAHELRND